MKTYLIYSALLAGFILGLQGCSKKSTQPSAPFPELVPKPYRVGNNWYQPLASAHRFREKGIASWYGPDFHGKKTSSGEIYDMYAMTAAHKLLPLGAVVRVKNLNNNRIVDVRVNDRGPFVRGRIIDLSYSAAKELEMIGPGTAPVEIEAIGAPGGATGRDGAGYVPADHFSGKFSVQVGAFQNEENARRLKDKLAKAYDNARVVSASDGGRTFFRVRVGDYDSLEKVMAVERELLENGCPGAFSVAE